MYDLCCIARVKASGKNLLGKWRDSFAAVRESDPAVGPLVIQTPALFCCLVAKVTLGVKPFFVFLRTGVEHLDVLEPVLPFACAAHDALAL